MTIASHTHVLSSLRQHCATVLQLVGPLSQQVYQPSIARSFISVAWDNFDLNEETPSGSGTTHGIAHGIAIQQVQNGAEVTDPDLQNVSELHERNAHLIINELEPCFAKAKAEPNFNVRKATPENCDFDDAKLSDFLWILVRKQLPQV